MTGFDLQSLQLWKQHWQSENFIHKLELKKNIHVFLLTAGVVLIYLPLAFHPYHLNLFPRLVWILMDFLANNCLEDRDIFFLVLSDEQQEVENTLAWVEIEL